MIGTFFLEKSIPNLALTMSVELGVDDFHLALLISQVLVIVHVLVDGRCHRNLFGVNLGLRTSAWGKFEGIYLTCEQVCIAIFKLIPFPLVTLYD